MPKSIGIRWLCWGLLVSLMAGPALATEKHAEFNVEKNREDRHKGNILNLFFGGPPPMASERGILVIDAFWDLNGNTLRDPGEKPLDREVFCLVDDVEYLVPAFIPGLRYDDGYKILCSGDSFKPAITKKQIFVKRRGQVFRLDLPCEKSDQYLAGRPPVLPAKKAAQAGGL